MAEFDLIPSNINARVSTVDGDDLTGHVLAQRAGEEGHRARDVLSFERTACGGALGQVRAGGRGGALSDRALGAVGLDEREADRVAENPERAQLVREVRD